ncbi:MAG: hypothetical protein E7167_00995 [Firmicutes bacterium]|nr:hypothetical protein [Bacillota bacterium]
MNGNNKKNFVLVIISAIIMLIVVGSLTYAYFTADVTANNTLNITSNISSGYRPVFTAYPDGNLALLVTTADMLDGDASNDYTAIGDTASQRYNVTLLANGATCTYSLYWTESSEFAYVPSPNATNAGLKEYTIKVVDSTGKTVLAETPVTTLQARANANKESILASNLSITSYDSAVTEVYTITATIYNLDVVQNIYNKNYTSYVGVTGITCE